MSSAIRPVENYRLDDDLLLDPAGSRRVFVWIVLAFVACFLVWAGASEIDEVTRGEGKVIPSSQVQVIQSLDGGILKEILIREGTLVEAGTPLLRIDDTRFQSDLAQREQETLALELSVLRLEAQQASVTLLPSTSNSAWTEQVKVNVSPPKFSDVLLGKAPEMIRRQREEFINHINQLKNQLAIQAQQIQKKENELKELGARLKSLGISYQLLQREFDMTKPLADKGIVSEVELIKLSRMANDAEGELESLRQKRPSLLLERDEAILKRREIALAFLSESQTELNELSSRLSRLTEANVSVRDKVDRTLIVSPVSGTIKSLKINTIGGVIAPGADLIEIVPSEDNLLVEVHVAPQDIAFLRPGLAATVKVSAYDFTRYGGLTGQVEHISADTITDEDGNSFYLVRVRTDSNILGKSDQTLPIIPGMVTSVDVITGQKSILAYLLTPILRARDNAFRER